MLLNNFCLSSVSVFSYNTPIVKDNETYNVVADMKLHNGHSIFIVYDGPVLITFALG